MRVSFRHTPRHDGIQIKLLRHKLLGWKLIVPPDWSKLTGKEQSATRFLLGLAERGDGEIKDDGVMLLHDAVAALPSSIAEAIGLPPLGTLSLTLAFQGIMTDPRSRIRASWYDADTRRVRIERVGALARWGSRQGRLSHPLFTLVEAVDAYNATENSEPGDRIAAWAPVQMALRATTGEEVRTEDNYLTTLTVYQAGAVALDVFETPYGPDFLPVVMGREKTANPNDNAPAPEIEGSDMPPPAERDIVSDALLPEPLQRRFAQEIFAAETISRDAYVLDRNTFLILDPSLKSALNVIRKKRASPRHERESFLKNPRSEFAMALGDETGELAETVLVETWQYSKRVLGLGIWEPPPMPWLQNKVGQWLPERFPLKIGSEVLEVDERLFEELKTQLMHARDEGVSEVQLGNRTLKVADVQDAFERLGLDTSEVWPLGLDEGSGPSPEPPPQPPAGDPPKPEVLVIRQNLDGNEFEVAYSEREAAFAAKLPSAPLVITHAKPHQKQGFDWLVRCYRGGWPGALLADDMGLGKTFQALTFLLWLKENRRKLRLDSGAQKRPVLIVAPTALLRNWAEEAERHLAPNALGERLDAFGSKLRHLKVARDEHWSAENALDVSKLRAAEWVLTTYETLADYHRAFARVAFSVAVFDEVQKIKSPGTINTQAAKAMNADFVLALTGTPIENRLADLWSIMDRVVPGYLGDLKKFVKTYENGGDEELRRLKSRLDEPPQENMAPVLLRRLKIDILEGLPKREVFKQKAQMPPEQAAAYEAAVVRAQTGGTGQGDMLQAIHAFRGISLHPERAAGCDPLDRTSVKEWFAKSARMRQTADILERLRSAGEKALVFIEDLEVQKTFTAAIATYLNLPLEPMVINGSVPGERRLEIVERFQKSDAAFDLLVLSPKSAGLGLTITAANHVIHLSRWWNPAVEDQCNDRCYRIGQEKPVSIHIPIAVHPGYGDASFDMTLDALLERKRKLSRDMLLPPVEDSDVKELFGRSIRAN